MKPLSAYVVSEGQILDDDKERELCELEPEP